MRRVLCLICSVLLLLTIGPAKINADELTVDLNITVGEDNSLTLKNAVIGETDVAQQVQIKWVTITDRQDGQPGPPDISDYEGSFNGEDNCYLLISFTHSEQFSSENRYRFRINSDDSKTGILGDGRYNSETSTSWVNGWISYNSLKGNNNQGPDTDPNGNDGNEPEQGGEVIIDISLDTTKTPDSMLQNFSAKIGDTDVTDKIELRWANVTPRYMDSALFDFDNLSFEGDNCCSLLVKYSVAPGNTRYFFRINNDNSKKEIFADGRSDCRYGWLSYTSVIAEGGQGMNDQNSIAGYYKFIDLPFDEETILRYGYFYYNDNGSLYCLGVSDNVISNKNRTFNIDVGVGFFKNTHLDMGTADGIPSNDYFQAIHPKSHSVINYNIKGGNVSFEEGFESIKFGDRDAFRVIANIDEGAFGDLILLVTFELNGKEYTIAQYIVISNAEEKSLDLDITGMNNEEILELINSTIGSMAGLQSRDPSVHKGTIQESSNVKVRLINTEKEQIDIYGDIIWGVGDDGPTDHNDYTFEVAQDTGPIIIHGSFINRGNTNNLGVNIRNLVFVGDGTGIAVNPEKGNIRIYDCVIDNYEYGSKSTQKSGECGYTQGIYGTKFANCNVALFSDVNSRRGMDSKEFTGIVFYKCKTAVKFLDLIPELSSVGLQITDCFFLECDVDFDMAHSSKFSGSDEYYLFPNNYYGNSFNFVDALHYKTPVVVTHSANGGDCYVATSPSRMFPGSKVAELGIDGDALTGMYSYVDYAINSRSLFRGATIILFDPDTGAPCGTMSLPR